MKFTVTKGQNSAQAQVGHRLVELEAGAELDTWDLDTCSTLRSVFGFEQVEESAGDVIEQLGELNDRELRTVLIFDDRPSVAKAVEDERAARAEAASEAEEASTEPEDGEA